MSKLQAANYYFDRFIFFIQNYCPKLSQRQSLIRKLQFLTLLRTIKNFGPFFLFGGGGDKHHDANWKYSKYWSTDINHVEELIVTADEFYKNEQYFDVYELLNRIKFSRNLEIQWRISRALYKLSYDKNVPSDEIRRNIINEAYEIIIDSIESSLLAASESSSIIHKWAALIIDRKSGMDSLQTRIKNSPIVKNHLIKSCELNPNDITAQYLLGRWCYEITHITWFQRIISKFLYATDPPTSTYQEAHKYLAKADDLQPRLYLQNTYFLGKTCLQLRQYYRAKYYLGLVANSPSNTTNKQEKQYVADAVKLMKRLNKYVTGPNTNALLYEYPFGVNE